MKLALISDIHGNLFAFDAVLEDIRQRKIEYILCLGDVVSSGPQQCEALQRLREIGCPTVMGIPMPGLLSLVYANTLTCMDRICRILNTGHHSSSTPKTKLF